MDVLPSLVGVPCLEHFGKSCKCGVLRGCNGPWLQCCWPPLVTLLPWCLCCSCHGCASLRSLRSYILLIIKCCMAVATASFLSSSAGNHAGRVHLPACQPTPPLRRACS